MRNLSLCLFLILGVTGSAFAQFGISAHYTHTDFAADYDPQYQNREWNTDRPTAGYRVALDYWFRLKKPRIEFLPTFSFTQGSGFELLDNGTSLGQLSYQHWSFFLNTNIYLFDLAGDCGCPTFSKEGPALQKGLFLQIGPGFTRERSRFEEPLTTTTSNSSHWGVQAGLGLDIGLNELVTITPLIGLRYYPQGPALYDAPRDPDITELAEPRVWQYFGGLRLGFRFNG
jgi:hypothetical protein